MYSLCMAGPCFDYTDKSTSTWSGMRGDLGNMTVLRKRSCAILADMATSTRKTSSSPSRPKAQVQQEFGEIRKQVAEEAEGADAKLAAAERQRESEVRQAVQDLSADDVVRNISNLGLDISKTLADLTRKLVD